jgi:hypothetical protein
LSCHGRDQRSRCASYADTRIGDALQSLANFAGGVDVVEERTVTEGRLRFVARLLEGEGMSEVCRDFGISRKPAYKIFNRYKAEGVSASIN